MRSALSLIVTLALLSSCGARKSAPEGDKDGQEQTQDGVPMLDVAALRERFASRRGKVLVVNVWASWCLPCDAEFDELEAISGMHPAEDVEVLAISIDEPSSRTTAVAHFLAKKSPTFSVVMRTRGDAQETLEALLDPSWDGHIPATFILDRDGKLRVTLVGAQRRDKLASAIASLLE